MSYNERLFSKGLRKSIHLARFEWLKKKCYEYDVCCDTVVELGCFDARSIDYLPELPSKYYGFDAGWEDGIREATEKYKNYSFIISSSPEDIKKIKNASLVLSLETLEHINPAILETYFSIMRDAMANNAYFILTVPNEKGIIFLLKYVFKILYYRGGSNYSFREIGASIIGRMEYVERNNHKGFDWHTMLKQLEKYFVVLKIEGVQTEWLPPSLNVNIGVICSK